MCRSRASAPKGGREGSPERQQLNGACLLRVWLLGVCWGGAPTHCRNAGRTQRATRQTHAPAAAREPSRERRAYLGRACATERSGPCRWIMDTARTASCARLPRRGCVLRSCGARRWLASAWDRFAFEYTCIIKTFSPRLTTPTRRARGPARPGMAAGAPRPGPRPTGRDGVAETAERRVRIRITREPRKSESSERGAGQPVRAVRCTARRAGTEVGAGHRPAESETRATPRATSCRTAGRAPPLLRWPAVPRPLDPRACPGSPLCKHDVYFLYPTRGAPRDLARSCGPPPESHRPPPPLPPLVAIPHGSESLAPVPHAVPSLTRSRPESRSASGQPVPPSPPPPPLPRVELPQPPAWAPASTPPPVRAQ